MMRLYPLESVPCPQNVTFLGTNNYSYSGENYMVANTSIYHKGQQIQAFACDSDHYDRSFVLWKPGLMTFYKDLDGDRVKFPAWACSYQSALNNKQETC